MTDKAWILSYQLDDFNYCMEAFHAIFFKQPSIEEIKEAIGSDEFTEEKAKQLNETGYVSDECGINQWHLRKYEDSNDLKSRMSEA